MDTLLIIALCLGSCLTAPSLGPKYDLDLGKGNPEQVLDFSLLGKPKLTDEAKKRFSPCGKDDEKWIYKKEFNACYKEIHDVSFNEAKEICLKFDSQLISIHSAEENQFIYDLIHTNETKWYSDHQSLLLGGLKLNETFTWIDGTPFNFQTWAQGEPNNYKLGYDNENCLAMFTFSMDYAYHLYPPEPYLARWNDNICSKTYTHSMCKKMALF
ncbi:unnamed protein product, partial [Mesorhabditis belari]|uniref:C-type lectin domain-containing protein n=1 Tax=Mesorhabditis belari TaxID=2138241 RepID=A0AAF3J7G5_9BILA